MDLPREDPNKNAHWGEMTGWNQGQRRNAGFKKLMLDPLTKEMIFLLHDTLFLHLFSLMLKMFSGSNRQKKRKKKERQKVDEERSTSSSNLD